MYSIIIMDACIVNPVKSLKRINIMSRWDLKTLDEALIAIHTAFDLKMYHCLEYRAGRFFLDNGLLLILIDVQKNGASWENSDSDLQRLQSLFVQSCKKFIRTSNVEGNQYAVQL